MSKQTFQKPKEIISMVLENDLYKLTLELKKIDVDEIYIPEFNLVILFCRE